MSLSEKKEVREVTELAKQGRYARSIENRLATGEEERIIDESADETTQQRCHDGAPDPVLTVKQTIQPLARVPQKKAYTYCLKLKTSFP